MQYDQFDSTVKMYVYEEYIDGKKLSEIINTQHENIKYLPGHSLSTNIVATTDVVEAAHDVDILIFVLPHQFIEKICKELVGKVKKNSYAVSLCKVIVY